MVEVFKTNVQQVEEAESLVKILVSNFPKHKINFDLDDCDKILRVEGATVFLESVINLVKSNNYHCELL